MISRTMNDRKLIETGDESIKIELEKSFFYFSKLNFVRLKISFQNDDFERFLSLLNVEIIKMTSSTNLSQ